MYVVCFNFFHFRLVLLVGPSITRVRGAAMPHLACVVHRRRFPARDVALAYLFRCWRLRTASAGICCLNRVFRFAMCQHVPRYQPMTCTGYSCPVRTATCFRLIPAIKAAAMMTRRIPRAVQGKLSKLQNKRCSWQTAPKMSIECYISWLCIPGISLLYLYRAACICIHA